MLRIGFDFDNTIVTYDQIFHTVAVERGAIPPNTSANKKIIRDIMRAAGKEDIWTEMQGYVYGVRIQEAQAFPGVINFMRACRERAEVYIVSHKTRHPYAGEKYDLHAAASGWLQAKGLTEIANAIYLEPTKESKLERIKTLNCDYFFDDLVEFLSLPTFPANCTPILFSPNPPTPLPPPLKLVVQDWAQATHVMEWNQVS